MTQKSEDKVVLIREALESEGFTVSDRKRGIRVETDTGYPVDIFSLQSNPNHIRARIKLDEVDPLRRQAFVEAIQNALSAGLAGTARLEAFRMSRATEDLFFYNAVIEPAASALTDATIEISADAVEIINTGETAELPAPGGTVDFQLDFDIPDDGRMKIGKSLAEEAMEMLETVDAKMLRQSLDMMSLKRSSVVRLAVTRICRDATDVEELEKAVRNEARKIVSPEDRMELQNLKAVSTNGFLDPIVDLLWQEVFNELY